MVEQTSEFNRIYDAYGGRVLAYITAKVGNMSDINDIFQETWLEVHRTLSKRGAQYIKNEAAFVIEAAGQRLYRYYKRADKRRSAEASSVAEDVEGEEVEILDLLPGEFSVEERVADADLISRIRASLAQYPLDVQKIFSLYFRQELPIREIAELLETGQSNVKNKLYRTLKELRKMSVEKRECPLGVDFEVRAHCGGYCRRRALRGGYAADNARSRRI